MPRLTGFRPDPPPKVRGADSFIYANAGGVLPLPWGEERLAVGGGGGGVLPLPRGEETAAHSHLIRARWGSLLRARGDDPGAGEGEPGRSGRQECEFCGAIPVMAFGEGSVGQGREQMVDQRADVECCRGGRQGHEFRGRLTPMTTVRCRGGWVPKTSAIRGCAMRLRGYDGGSRRMRSAGDPVCSRVAPDPGDARSRRGTRPISSRNPTDLDEGVAPGPAPGGCWPPSVRRGRATR